MKSVGGYLIAGVLAIVAAMLVAQGEPGVAEVHLAHAAASPWAWWGPAGWPFFWEP